MADAYEQLLDQKIQRLIISAPPRAGKSFMASLFLSWLIGIDDGTYQILASYGSRLTGLLNKQVYNCIKSPAFIKIFPNFKGFEKNQKNTLKGGGNIFATSVGGACTGVTAGTKSMESTGIGIFLCDDPLKNGYSQAALEELENWWKVEANSRRTNRWGQLIIATRFHTNDLHGQVIRSDGLYSENNPSGWHWANFKALCDNESTDILGRKNGESFWESNPIFSREVLQSVKKGMGETAFSAMYQGEPVSESGCLFSPQYFHFGAMEEKSTKYLSADTALEDNTENCLSVITAFSVPHKQEKIFVTEQISGHWDFPELLDNSIEAAKYYKAKWYVIEDCVSGKSLRQVLSKKTDFKPDIISIKPIRSKHLRLQKVLPLFESGKVIFSMDAKQNNWFLPLKEALMNAPLITGQQWDLIDSLVNGLLYFQEFIDSEGISQSVSDVVKWNSNKNFKRPTNYL